YILSNAGLLHSNGFAILGVLNVHPQSIAGLLSRNPYPFQINGSLWTLPFEFVCYLAVATLALFGVIRRARFFAVGLFVILWSLHAYNYLWPKSFSHAFPGAGITMFIPLGLFFSVGSLCFLYRE